MSGRGLRVTCSWRHKSALCPLIRVTRSVNSLEKLARFPASPLLCSNAQGCPQCSRTRPSPPHQLKTVLARELFFSSDRVPTFDPLLRVRLLPDTRKASPPFLPYSALNAHSGVSPRSGNTPQYNRQSTNRVLNGIITSTITKYFQE